MSYLIFGLIALALMGTLTLMLRTKDDATKAVLGDMIFYCMIACYVVWTIAFDTSIVYEVVTLGALLGLLSTVAVSRILSKGRR